MELVIHSMEGALGRTGTIVVCPAPNARVQGCDEGRLVAPAVGTDKCFHMFQVTFLGFLTRFDDHLVTVSTVMFSHRELSDGETKEVKPDATFVFMEAVCNTGLTGVQSQTDFSQPGLSRPSSALQGRQVFAENDEVIRKANDRDAVFLRKGSCQGGFETMQGYIRKQGGSYPTLGCPCFGWKDCPFFEDARLQPTAHLSVDVREAVEFG